MKKVFKSVLCVAMVMAVVMAFAACGEKGKTYTGKFSQEEYGHTYNIEVKVTVKDDKITKVVLTPETAEKFNASPDSPYETKWKAGYEAALKAYNGKTVKEVKAMTTDVTGDFNVSNATHSANRLLKAIQNALEEA